MSITANHCRECEYVCKCCSARDNCLEACTRCSTDHAQFIPAKYIRYCPFDGDVVENFFTTHCVVMGRGVDERRKIQTALEQYFTSHQLEKNVIEEE